jgi:hypothetical protein
MNILAPKTPKIMKEPKEGPFSLGGYSSENIVLVGVSAGGW